MNYLDLSERTVAEALSESSTHGQVFTTADRGAEIELGPQPKKMSKTTQCLLDDADYMQTGWQGEKEGSEDGWGRARRCVTEL